MPDSDEAPFTDEEIRWIDRRIREAIEAHGTAGLELDDVLSDDPDGPPPCPECGDDQRQPIGSTDPVCLNCDF